MTDHSQILLVITNCPDVVCAEAIARQTVDQGLAACANILAPCRSIYRWQGAVEEACEIPLLLKTRADRYPKLEALITALHPYDLPEIIALPLAQGLPKYLAWVGKECMEVSL